MSGEAVAKPSTVLLLPDKADAGWVGLQWINWCGSAGGSVTVRATLPDGETIQVPAGANPWNVTTCQSPNTASILVEGPVTEPHTYP